MKAKIRLEKWEKAVVMQVLEMDEELKSREIHLAVEGMLVIGSALAPSLEREWVYLRGEEGGSDYDVVSISFDTNEKRDEYFDKVVATFKAWQEVENGKEQESGDSIILAVE